MGERRRRWWAAMLVVGTLGLAGCAGIDEHAVSERLVEQTDVRGAIVEVQHPNAPWVDKTVIRLFVPDGSPEAVADDIRDVARVAVDDSDLAGRELTFMSVEGAPEDFSDPLTATITDGLYVMGSVAQILGTGDGVEQLLTLTSDQVRQVAEQ